MLCKVVVWRWQVRQVLMFQHASLPVGSLKWCSRSSRVPLIFTDCVLSAWLLALIRGLIVMVVGGNWTTSFCSTTEVTLKNDDNVWLYYPCTFCRSVDVLCVVEIEQNHFAPPLITEVIPKYDDNVFCTLFSHEKSIKLFFIAFCRFMTVNKPQYGYFVDRNILSWKAGQLPCWYLV